MGYVAGFIFSLPLHPCGRQKWFEEVSVLQRQAHLPVRTIPRLTLVLALSAMALANTACDYFYNVSIENATDQEVVVKVLWVDRNLRPCSVQGSIAWHGPPSGESIEAEAHAVGGEEIPAEVRVVPPNDRSVWPGVYVRILPQQTLSCPDPILHMYLLTVKNLALNSIDMWMDGVHLGKVDARSDATFGLCWAVGRGVGHWRFDPIRRICSARITATGGPGTMTWVKCPGESSHLEVKDWVETIPKTVGGHL